MSHDAVIERIRKLLALATSSNEHEAAAAAARAADMMREHQIEEAQLRANDPEIKAEPIERATIDDAAKAGRTKLVTWRLTLASALAKAMGCYAWFYGADIRVMGRASASRTVFYLFNYLTAEIDRLAREQGKGRGKAWSNAFRLGAVESVRDRMLAGKREQEAKQTASTTALAIVKRDQEAVDRAYKELSKGFRTRHATFSNGDGYQAGRNAGHSINLSGGKGLGAAPGKLTGR